MRRTINTGAGLRLRKIREELNMTQEQMSEVLDLVPKYLAQIENESRNISTTTLYMACERLSVSADYLFLGKQPENLKDKSVIYEMLNNLDEEYLPLAEEMLKTFILAVNKSKKLNS